MTEFGYLDPQRKSYKVLLIVDNALQFGEIGFLQEIIILVTFTKFSQSLASIVASYQYAMLSIPVATYMQ